MLNYIRILAATVLILFFLKIAVVFFYQDQIGVWEDDVIARNMLETGEMFYMQRGTPNYMFQFPVYPSLLFVTYKTFGYDPFYAIVLNIVILSVTGVFLYKIFIDICMMQDLKLQRVKPELIALVSVLAFLLHPFISYYSMFKVHPFILDMFFPVLIIFFSVKYLQLPSWQNLGLFTFSSGFGMLNRSTAFVALLPFVILGVQLLGVRKTMLNLVVVFSVTALIVSPWLMRGYRLYGRATMAPMLSEVLWKGSLYGGDGSNYLLDGRTYNSVLSQGENEFLQGKPITVQNEFFRKKYVELRREDPQHVVAMYLMKLKNFWLYHKNIGIEYGDRIQSFLITYKLYVYFILVLNLGAVFLFNYKPLVLLSYPIGLSLVQSIFYVETRHRMITEPFLLFFGILTVLVLWERTIHKSNRQSTAQIQL
jgi:hypothetical protein|tara:strand:+ start:1508 stop:2776 length:1269 start_codon:yes stop_codon:yes gene_type:complete